MLPAKTILLLFLPLCFSKSVDITFKKVTFRGYSLYTEKFKKTIPSSNSLKEFLPKSAFDKIEFIEQKIPVLYENSLADLEDLDELVIEHCNKLEEIKEGVFNNLALSTLDLSQNDITTIESSAFDNLPNILNINLADNNIGAWDKNWFKNTPLLTRISMQNNSIAKLPNNAFKNLVGVKKFGKVDLTINLVLSYNKIKTIEPKAFNGLTKINNLWLDNNQLENFDENLLDKVKVNDLRINQNNIRCLDGDLAKIIKADTTHLDANPLDCECLNNIKTWAEKNGKVIEIFFSEMDCAAQRIKMKMNALTKRLKEIRDQDNDIEVAEGHPTSNPIK
ncbi:hypothetical protein NQ314_005768 [Rhamnusium bicolor]|uniref:Uncharacterized protein n=1 Tax=Rhamnusium bicolor TaxID=1586634 RepID=A0AAV8ZDG4_9CUCU|nr:hypothetical protein NQ314_005768 [Rhamnusium bicolor]